MSVAVELWQELEAPSALELWRALEARHNLRGPDGRFIPGPGGGGGSDRPSLADVIRGTAALGPKRQRVDKGMSVADAVRSAARRSDSTGRPTQRTPEQHRAEGAHAVADEVDRALADAGVPEDVRRMVAQRARDAADAQGPPKRKPTRAAAASSPAAPTTNPAHETAVRDAVARLSGGRDEWVGLADLRAELGSMSRDEQDTVLRQLAITPGVQVEEETNQKGLRPVDRDAAVHIGGRDQHVIKIGPAPAPAPDRPRAPRAPRTFDRAAAATVASKLETASSMDDGHAALAGLTVPQLRQVAEMLGVATGSGDTKARARDRIVDSVVGRRLDSAAIDRMTRR